MAKKKAFIKNTKNTKNTQKSRKSPSKAKKAKRVARKPSVKKTPRKPPAKKSAKSATKKTTKKAVRKGVKKTATKAIKKVAKSVGKKKRASSTRPAGKKVKSPLTQKQLQEFRALLLEKRKSLLGDMTGIQAGALGRNLQESSGDLSNMPTHPADIGSDNFEHEFTLGLLESERSLLLEIHEALERIDDGTFGVCLGTGDPIGIARLKARPWCKHCIEYQKMIEKGLVRPGHSNSYDSPVEDEDKDKGEMEDQED